MGMTLEEAITHCLEVAEAEEQKYKDWKGDYSHLNKIDSCLECASEHRQLAEWLRKLKAYKEAKEKIELKAEKCPQDEIRYGMLSALYVLEKCLKEVNADAKTEDT